jgi:phosphoglycolate phosphatase-like HAD superfamily hydrolase
MIGDKWIDAEAGLRAKMNSALVRTGKKIEPDVQKLAQSENVPVCDDLLSFTRNYLLKSL